MRLAFAGIAVRVGVLGALLCVATQAGAGSFSITYSITGGRVCFGACGTNGAPAKGAISVSGNAFRATPSATSGVLTPTSAVLRVYRYTTPPIPIFSYYSGWKTNTLSLIPLTPTPFGFFYGATPLGAAVSRAQASGMLPAGASWQPTVDGTTMYAPAAHPLPYALRYPPSAFVSVIFGTALYPYAMACAFRNYPSLDCPLYAYTINPAYNTGFAAISGTEVSSTIDVPEPRRTGLLAWGAGALVVVHRLWRQPGRGCRFRGQVCALDRLGYQNPAFARPFAVQDHHQGGPQTVHDLDLVPLYPLHIHQVIFNNLATAQAQDDFIPKSQLAHRVAHFLTVGYCYYPAQFCAR